MNLTSQSPLNKVVNYLSKLYFNYNVNDSFDDGDGNDSFDDLNINNNSFKDDGNDDRIPSSPSSSINDILIKVWNLKFKSIFIGELIGKNAIKHCQNPSFLVNHILQTLEKEYSSSKSLTLADIPSSISCLITIVSQFPTTTTTTTTTMSTMISPYTIQQIIRLIIRNLQDWGQHLSNFIVNDFFPLVRDITFENDFYQAIMNNLEVPSLENLMIHLILLPNFQPPPHIFSKIRKWINIPNSKNKLPLLVWINKEKITDIDGKISFISHYSTKLDPKYLAFLVKLIIPNVTSLPELSIYIPRITECSLCYRKKFIKELALIFPHLHYCDDDDDDDEDGTLKEDNPFYDAYIVNLLLQYNKERKPLIFTKTFTTPNESIIASIRLMDPFSRLSFIEGCFVHLKLQQTISDFKLKNVISLPAPLSTSLAYLLRHSLEIQSSSLDSLSRLEVDLLEGIHTFLKGNIPLIPLIIEGLFFWEQVLTCKELLSLLDSSLIISLSFPPMHPLLPKIDDYIKGGGGGGDGNWISFRKMNIFSYPSFKDFPTDLGFDWIWNGAEDFRFPFNFLKTFFKNSSQLPLPPLTIPTKGKSFTPNQIDYLLFFYSHQKLPNDTFLAMHRDFLLSSCDESLHKVLASFIAGNPIIQDSVIEYLVQKVLDSNLGGRGSGGVSANDVHSYLCTLSHAISCTNPIRMEFLGFFFSFTKVNFHPLIRKSAFDAIFLVLKKDRRRPFHRIEDSLFKDLLKIVCIEIYNPLMAEIPIDAYLLLFLEEMYHYGHHSDVILNEYIIPLIEARIITTFLVKGTSSSSSSLPLPSSQSSSDLLECISLLIQRNVNNLRDKMIVANILSPKDHPTPLHINVLRILLLKEEENNEDYQRQPSLIGGFIKRVFNMEGSRALIQQILFKNNFLVLKFLWNDVFHFFDENYFLNLLKITQKLDDDALLIQGIHLSILKTSFHFCSINERRQRPDRIVHLSHLSILKRLCFIKELKAQLISIYSLLLKNYNGSGGGCGSGGDLFLYWICLTHFYCAFPSEERRCHLLNDGLCLREKAFPTLAMKDYLSLLIYHCLKIWNSPLIIRILSYHASIIPLVIDKITFMINNCFHEVVSNSSSDDDDDLCNAYIAALMLENCKSPPLIIERIKSLNVIDSKNTHTKEIITKYLKESNSIPVVLRCLKILPRCDGNLFLGIKGITRDSFLA